MIQNVYLIYQIIFCPLLMLRKFSTCTTSKLKNQVSSSIVPSFIIIINIIIIITIIVIIIILFSFFSGFWLFHCHIAFHMEMGMSLVIQVGEVDEMPEPPKNFPRCGDWTPDTPDQQDLQEIKPCPSQTKSADSASMAVSMTTLTLVIILLNIYVLFVSFLL